MFYIFELIARTDMIDEVYRERPLTTLYNKNYIDHFNLRTKKQIQDRRH